MYVLYAQSTVGVYMLLHILIVTLLLFYFSSAADPVYADIGERLGGGAGLAEGTLTAGTGTNRMHTEPTPNTQHHTTTGLENIIDI